MKNNNIFQNKKVFALFSISILLIAWSSLILTELRIYNIKIILLLLSTIIIFFLFNIKRINYSHCFTDKFDLIVIGIIVLFSLFNGIFAHETFFGGRDDGIYSMSAIYLAKNHSLLINNHLIKTNIVGYINVFKNYYQPGFHFAYISWLAIHYSLFGLGGIMWANFIPTI